MPLRARPRYRRDRRADRRAARRDPASSAAASPRRRAGAGSPGLSAGSAATASRSRSSTSHGANSAATSNARSNSTRASSSRRSTRTNSARRAANPTGFWSSTTKFATARLRGRRPTMSPRWRNSPGSPPPLLSRPCSPRRPHCCRSTILPIWRWCRICPTRSARPNSPAGAASPGARTCALSRVTLPRVLARPPWEDDPARARRVPLRRIRARPRLAGSG